MSSIPMPSAGPFAARDLVARVRGQWRRRVLVRATLHAIALGLACAAMLVLLDQLLALPAAVRAVLRPLVPIAPLVVFGRALRAAFPGPSTSRLALLAEEYGAAGHELSAALAVHDDGPVARAFLSRAEQRLASLPGRLIPLDARRPLTMAATMLAACALLVALVPGGLAEIGARWLRLARDPATGLGPVPVATVGRTADEAALELRDVRVFVRPPAYAGGGEREARDGIVVALAGSTIRVVGHAPAGADVGVRVLGGETAAVRLDGSEFSVAHAAKTSDRGVEIVATTGADTVARRVVPFDVRADAPPAVELREPQEDVVVATPRGVIPIVASATDDHGIASFRLAWILSRGSGESFSFTDGSAEWEETRVEAGARVGRYGLDLAALGLEPGDVLHVRAIAADGNTVTGPGEGVSVTRVIRIARAGEEAEATTLIGFPLEPEKDPILSQRMIVLLTERLIERTPSVSRDEVLVESEEIARQQARLRERLADIIYARTSGEEEGDVAHAELERPRMPPVDSLTPAEREARMREILALASAATGQGTLEELSHDHDPDPALMVNLPLVPAFNAMYEAERWLRQADPQEALPHELRALEIIQRVREAERVFVRGSQTVAPVDVAGVRGTGKIDDAAPAARSAIRTPGDARDHVAALTDAAAALDTLATRPAALLLSDLSARLLDDADVDARAGRQLAEAAAAARAGDVAAARQLTASARAVLVPPSGAAVASRVGAPVSAASARYLAARMPASSGSTDTGATPARPFTFATARYASGDWDSAQLVPANLIHSLALYTGMPVEPEGVVVDLDSPDLFACPFVWLTGHLPVRFSAAEAANLKAYVERGGFIFIDDHNHDIDGAFHRTVTAEVERIFGPGALEQLPSDHELYRAFFHFEDGPPTTSHELNGWGDGLIHEHLFAVRAPDGRIGLLYSNKDYSSEWSYHVQNKRFLALDNTRFGVNLLVYALTR